jgi:hypothetical protein
MENFHLGVRRLAAVGAFITIEAHLVPIVRATASDIAVQAGWCC